MAMSLLYGLELRALWNWFEQKLDLMPTEEDLIFSHVFPLRHHLSLPLQQTHILIVLKYPQFQCPTAYLHRWVIFTDCMSNLWDRKHGPCCPNSVFNSSSGGLTPKTAVCSGALYSCSFQTDDTLDTREQ